MEALYKEWCMESVIYIKTYHSVDPNVHGKFYLHKNIPFFDLNLSSLRLLLDYSFKRKSTLLFYQ